MYTYLSSNLLQENDATHPTYLSGPMDTQKSRYNSPVDHRSLDDLWPQITRWSVHKYINNVTKVMCALYIRCTLSVLQKECRKVWDARYRSENTVIVLHCMVPSQHLPGQTADNYKRPQQQQSVFWPRLKMYTSCAHSETLQLWANLPGVLYTVYSTASTNSFLLYVRLHLYVNSPLNTKNKRWHGKVWHMRSQK